MNKLPIGEVIFKLRKEKGITQDQLGGFIGVSTAAVSKWESGISYPDITLLPIIATFFNVSIDRLLNFKVELSDEEVMEIFSECEKIFSSGDLDKAIEKSKSYVLKHPGSYYLKFRIGFLFSMYSWKGKDEDEVRHMIGYAIDLFGDVSKNSSKIELVEASLFQLGALYLGMEEENKAIEALNKINKSNCDPNDILSSIYIKKNEVKKARELLQSKLYKSMNDMSLACIGLANSYEKDESNMDMIERYYDLSISIKKVFSPEGDSLIGLSMEYLSLVQVYLKLNKKEKSIALLKKLVEDVKINDINKVGKFKDVWCFNHIPEGKRTITMNLYENLFKIFQEKEFDLIREEEEFLQIIKDLKVLEEKSLSKL